jgi:tetratricopeptide (TPR) repeat protein
MTETRPLPEETAVADKRRLVADQGDRHRPELAKALLDLSRAYEQDDRMEEALAAAREGVATLSPDFLAKPQSFAMRALLAQYVGLAQRSRAQVDEALLARIAQALGDLTRAEDEAEDSNQ